MFCNIEIGKHMVWFTSAVMFLHIFVCHSSHATLKLGMAGNDDMNGQFGHGIFLYEIKFLPTFLCNYLYAFVSFMLHIIVAAIKTT